MLGHRAQPPRTSAGVFAGTQTGVAGDLPPVGEARPVTYFPIDDFTAQSPQPNRLRSLGRLLHRLGQALRFLVRL